MGQCAPSVPVWSGRDGWLTGLGEWASAPAFSDAKTSARVSIAAATLLAIAAAMAAHADHRTGRHVAATRATIAARAGCSQRMVTAAWKLLRAAGWAIEAQRGHGSAGTPAGGRRPSVYHLVPRREPRPAVHNCHLPPKAGSCSLPSVGNYSPSARKARAEGKPSKEQRRKRRPPAAATISPEARGIAAWLAGHSHGLFHATGRPDREHSGALAIALDRSHLDLAAWSGPSIAAALDADMKARGWSWPDRIDRPGAFLASRLRRLDWRPCGLPKSGGAAATSPDGATPAWEPPGPEERKRIEAIRAEIAATLAAARRRRSGAGFGAFGAGAGCGKTQLAELGHGE